MIINKDFYYCSKCKKAYSFDTSKPYSKLCPICNIEMEFDSNNDCDTDLAEKAKDKPPYDPTKDPNSPYYIPIITCPTCSSTNIKRVSNTSKVASVAMFGLLSQKVKKTFHCNSCGYEW